MPISTRNSTKTMSNQRKTSHDDVSRKISTSKLSSENKEIFTLFLALFSTINAERDAKIVQLEQKMEENRIKGEEKVKDLETQMQTLQSKISSIESSQSKNIKSLQNNVDENDQYERKDTLIVSGPEVPVFSSNENCKNVLQDIFRRNLNLNINPADISVAHRLGRKPESGIDKRNIIFKLCRRDIVFDIFNACKKFRHPNSSNQGTPSRQPLYVNCSLTPLRSKIFYQLRQLWKKFPNKITSCRSDYGNIVVFTPSSSPSSSSTALSSRRIMINSREAFEDFVANILQTSSENIGIKW